MRSLSIVLAFAFALGACGNSPAPPQPSVQSVTPAVSATTATTGATGSEPTGTAAPSATPGAELDACALIGNIPRIEGGQVVLAKPMPAGGWVASGCSLSSPTASFLISIGTAASIQAFGDPAAPDAKAKLVAFKKRTGAASPAKDLAGIGDGAAISTAGIAAYKGGTYLEIMRLSGTDERLIEIAKELVAKL